ncbi:MAG: hypothetical protein QY318_01735 [Candidatus Dojkabacteria bacterium]|nr:MAG: hypothetical protein QY318_01735 [Candidatus Dojkabacteria bacterium]
MAENSARHSAKRRQLKGEQSGLIKLLVRLGLVMMTFFLLYQTGLTIYHTQEKLMIIENAKQEVDNLRLENLEVYIENREVTSDDHVETESRDRLNYTQDGEVVFVIQESLLEKPELKHYIEAVKSGEEENLGRDKKVYQYWVEFFQGYYTGI